MKNGLFYMRLSLFLDELLGFLPQNLVLLNIYKADIFWYYA